MSDKKKPEKNKEVVVKLDVVDHIIQRVDHYLYKKWPDMFIEDNLKKFKGDMNKIYDDLIVLGNDMQGKEQRINARCKETEAALLRHRKDMEELVEKRISEFKREIEVKLSDRKWWQFWKPSFYVIKKVDKEEDE